MKPPSRDIGVSLLAQRGPVGRRPEKIEVTTGQKPVSMIVPGDADVHLAPGQVHGRCACKFVDPQGRFGGFSVAGE